jgi:hypothetical protein
MNKKKLTRKEFEAGTGFYMESDCLLYRYEDIVMGGIISGGIIPDDRHVCNIDQINDTGFHFYASVLGVGVGGFVKFDDLYSIDE